MGLTMAVFPISVMRIVAVTMVLKAELIFIFSETI
jgi:hypothetical protein